MRIALRHHQAQKEFSHSEKASAFEWNYDPLGKGIPASSPFSIARFTAHKLYTLSIHLHEAFTRFENRRTESENRSHFESEEKVIGIVGPAQLCNGIASILYGSGWSILACDVDTQRALVTPFGIQYVKLEKLCRKSDVIVFDLPLNQDTIIRVDSCLISEMKEGVMLINSGHPGVMNFEDLYEEIKAGRVGYAGIDVARKDSGLILDETHNKLVSGIREELASHPDVMLTAHSPFLTGVSLHVSATSPMWHIESSTHEWLSLSPVKSAISAS